MDEMVERILVKNFREKSLDDILIMAQEYISKGQDAEANAQRELVARYRPEDLRHYDRVMEMEA